jgi:hypothetical protein
VPPHIPRAATPSFASGGITGLGRRKEEETMEADIEKKIHMRAGEHERI